MYTVDVKYRHLSSLRLPLLAAGVVLLCLAALYALVQSSQSLPDVVIIRTASGFVPSKVTVRKGQAVVFKTTENKPFWPASNFHPSHGMFPAFDPKRELQPDESWRFAFTKAGVWQFHDHLAERMWGTVIVIGKPGEGLAECLSHADTSPDGTGAECWAVDIAATLQARGLQAAFDMFSSHYANNQAFQGLGCHDAGHLLGSEAYKVYADDHTVIDRIETSYCGYGFYHGFMEAMLIEQGPTEYENVRQYCDAFKTAGQLNNPSGACYHGIGHAAFDSIPGDLWGDEDRMVRAGLDVCEAAATGAPEQAQCATGVFNALAAAESARSYNLAFKTVDPMRLCRTQQPEYQRACYSEMGIGVIRENKYDRAGTLAFMASLGSTEAYATVLRGYMGDEIARAIADIDLNAFHSFCGSYNTEKRAACNLGVLSGLRQAGAPGKEYGLMFDYCTLFSLGNERTECIRFTIIQSKPIASNTDAFRAHCKSIAAPELSSQCN